MKQKHLVGCSGFHYKDWKGTFYPEDIPQKQWLEYYAKHFDTVEINNSFYRMPKEDTVKHWYERVPNRFSFTLKGSRYITHVKKLNDPEEHVKKFYHLADLLRDKLGCILWQLPPNLHVNIEKLKRFCGALNPAYHNVIEFRHMSWYDEAVYNILQEHRVAFCIISAPDDLPEDQVSTADFAYVRFHGKTDWYNYKYSQEEMKKWGENIRALDAKQVYVYFNNDWNTNAVKDARQLLDVLK